MGHPAVGPNVLALGDVGDGHLELRSDLGFPKRMRPRAPARVAAQVLRLGTNKRRLAQDDNSLGTPPGGVVFLKSVSYRGGYGVSG